MGEGGKHLCHVELTPGESIPVVGEVFLAQAHQALQVAALIRSRALHLCPTVAVAQLPHGHPISQPLGSQSHRAWLRKALVTLKAPN